MTDLEVERDFWKKAAEEALALLFAQEDVSIALRAKVIEACNVGLALTFGSPSRVEQLALAELFGRMRDAIMAEEGPTE